MSFGGKQIVDESVNIDGRGWPSLSTGDFRQLRRIPTTFDNDSMVMAIRIAAKTVQKQLYKLLDDENLPPTFDETDTALYCRAVYGRAHADLLPEFATQDRRKEANNLAENGPEQVDEFISQSGRDIRLLLGLSSVSVGVI
ncbi:MAG: hypothetical protein ACI935_000067 [Moritella dasanensis]|jgi:hypothetical protein